MAENPEKFESTPHEVTAVRWTGEITPAITSLLGGQEVEVEGWWPPTGRPPTGRPRLVIRNPGEEAPLLAEVGQWVLRLDKRDQSDAPQFQLDVVSDERFRRSYRPAGQATDLNVSLTFPARLAAPSGETADATIRLDLRTAGTSAEQGRAHLARLHEQLGAQLFPGRSVWPDDLVRQFARSVGLDLDCVTCVALAGSDRPPLPVLSFGHEDDCRTVRSIRERLGSRDRESRQDLSQRDLAAAAAQDEVRRIIAFLARELPREGDRSCVSLGLYQGPVGSAGQEIRTWHRAEEPGLFEDLGGYEQLATQVMTMAREQSAGSGAGQHRFELRTRQHLQGGARIPFLVQVE